jgi:nucleotide-binding universal stress UspA family protein
MTTPLPAPTRSLLIVIDASEECDRAIVFAAKQAQRLGAGLVCLSVVALDDFRNQSLFGVGDVMREETMAIAQARLEAASRRARGVADVSVAQIIREGDAVEQINALIAEDAGLAMLVLAAGTGQDGPGPLVTGLARNSGAFPLPIMLVPGHLSDEAIQGLT